MQRNSFKLFLYIQLNNVELGDIEVSPGGKIFDVSNGVVTYEFAHNPTTVSKIAVSLLKKPNSDSAAIITKIECNGIELGQRDLWSHYKTVSGEMINGTFGYLGHVGTYTLKIRYSPLSQNFLTYLVNKFVLQ
jgi:hypothetical protein